MILEIDKHKYQHETSVWTNANKAYSRIAGLNFFNPHKGWSSGPTALWYASTQGHTEVYILGFDYQGVEGKFNNVYSDTYNYKKSSDIATYHGNWLTQTEKVIKEFPESQLCLAGDGILNKELKSYAQNKNLLKSITFLGSIKNVNELLGLSNTTRSLEGKCKCECRCK